MGPVGLSSSGEDMIPMHHSEISRACTQKKLKSVLSKALGRSTRNHQDTSGQRKVENAMQIDEKRLPNEEEPGDCMNTGSGTMVHHLSEIKSGDEIRKQITQNEHISIMALPYRLKTSRACWTQCWIR